MNLENIISKTKKSLKRLAYAGLVSLALAGGVRSAKATPVNSTSIIKDNIEYYMQTDKAVYDLGEDVSMLYRVKNLGSEDVMFGFGQSPEWNFWVEINGENIWRAVNGWWLVQTEFTLFPNNSKEFPTITPPYMWDMRDDENNLLNVGEYSVIGGLYLGVGNPDYYNYTRVSVPIQIIPEPSILALFGSGLGLLLLQKYKKKKNSK